MVDLILTTFDRVPEKPRGYVRDIRVRWALEEAGLPYRVESVPFGDRKPAHFAHQPFGQVPWLTDGDISIFESGAILLHLGELSPALMPADPQGCVPQGPAQASGAGAGRTRMAGGVVLRRRYPDGGCAPPCRSLRRARGPPCLP